MIVNHFKNALLLALLCGGSAAFAFNPGMAIQKAKNVRQQVENRSASDAAEADGKTAHREDAAPSESPRPAASPTAAAPAEKKAEGTTPAATKTPKKGHLAFGVPGRCDILIKRQGNALGYLKYHRQPAWVAYYLPDWKAAAAKPVPNNRKLQQDPQITGSRALPEDYLKSGWVAAQLAPAADLAYSDRSLNDSFFISNVSPQKPAFHQGIWKNLEEQIRAFAVAEKDIYVVTGPIFPKSRRQTIGKSKITVPTHFYKVVYDHTPPEKMIGFIIPNEGTERPLQEFAVPVAEVEKRTGLVFFNELPKERQASLKNTLSVKSWKWRK